jgi:hypothetical protein
VDYTITSKNHGNFVKCISRVGSDAESEPPCLLHYTLGSPVRSLGFAISSKFQEKFHSFSEGDSDFLENSAPPAWATTLTSMASYHGVPQDEDFPYTKNSKISKGFQICTLSEKNEGRKIFP